MKIFWVLRKQADVVDWMALLEAKVPEAYAASAFECGIISGPRKRRSKRTGSGPKESLKRARNSRNPVLVCLSDWEDVVFPGIWKRKMAGGGCPLLIYKT
ncbi:hypothetical protein TWF481_006681 [Arthrobotrys musiformis]|uniref:Uncharacterized protein n=1 Tax=Arthrobotrys musiformis TaxID=47236 RepID=A0AAV9W983_9PEZI